MKSRGVNGWAKAVAIVWLAHGLKSVSHAFGIAVVTSRTDFGAAGDRVPSRLGPFDSCLSGHLNLPKNVVGDAYSDFGSTRIAGGKKKLKERGVLGVTEQSGIGGYLGEEGFQALDEEGADGFCVACSLGCLLCAEYGAVLWAAIECLEPCFGSEDGVEALSAGSVRVFGQESVDGHQWE